MPMHWPPAVGHSNGVTWPVAGVVVVGVKVSWTVQVVGPTAPLQVPPPKLNGGLSPEMPVAPPKL